MVLMLMVMMYGSGKYLAIMSKINTDTVTMYDPRTNISVNNFLDITSSSTNSTFKDALVFVKVHRSASSTVHNILLRYAMSHDRDVIMQWQSYHSNDTGHVINRTELVLPDGYRVATSCSHVVVNEARVDQLETLGSRSSGHVYISAIRDPFSQFLSSFTYFGAAETYIADAIRADPENPVDEFLLNNSDYLRGRDPRSVVLDNRMSLDFGFPLQEYRLSNSKKTMVSEFLEILSEKFNLIIILEMFEESLVLMKNILGWEIRDILYLNVKTFIPNEDTPDWAFRKTFSYKVEQVFNRFADVDTALYEHFLNKLQREIDAQPPVFLEEVNDFKHLREEISRSCESGTSLPVHFPATQFIGDVTVTSSDCQMMLLDDVMIHERFKHFLLDKKDRS